MSSGKNIDFQVNFKLPLYSIVSDICTTHNMYHSNKKKLKAQ